MIRLIIVLTTKLTRNAGSLNPSSEPRFPTSDKKKLSVTPISRLIVIPIFFMFMFLPFLKEKIYYIKRPPP
jgi:hypothetical protein